MGQPLGSKIKSPKRNHDRRLHVVDVLSPEQRRLNMSRIRGRDTKPEMMIRQGLHARGLRFRLHRRDLPGTPDLVFPHARAAIFVHGCFWHGHNCHLSKVPSTRSDFWRSKIRANADRDAAAQAALQGEGWRIFVVWECALRGRKRRRVSDVLDACASFVCDSGREPCEIGGVDSGASQSLEGSAGRNRMQLSR